jgi:hypothetical protein
MPRRMLRHLTQLGLLLVLSLVARSAAATTYSVGPTRALKTLQDVQLLLAPGDVVELDGDATYPGGVYFRIGQSGTVAQKVTIRGIKTNGKRPVISGGGTGVLDGLGMVLNGSHYVLESLEVTASSSMCIVHKGDDITIRDFVVHDCPGQGLLGNDDEAGSLTLEFSEFYRNGNGTFQHQIYMATGEDMYPGSVFRMQNCYVHDGNGGNNVKSRSERNEIYYNWIEGAYYHNVELIGPDKSPATPTREDSDVVGNVIIGNGSQAWHLVRVGGDKAEADTSGRYRFVNNTFVVGAAGNSSVVRLMLRIDTVEMHDNAFVRAGAGTAPLFSTSEVVWVNGESLFGTNNWVQTGLTGTPSTWTNTFTGADAGLVNVAAFDVRLATATSPLADNAVANPASVPGRAFPNPLASPAFVPPMRQIVSAATPRLTVGALDIGAYEFGTTATPPADGGTPPPTDAGTTPPSDAGTTPGDPGTTPPGDASTTPTGTGTTPTGTGTGTTPPTGSGPGNATATGADAGAGGASDAAASDAGCGCGVVGAHGAASAVWLAGIAILWCARRRRRSRSTRR